MKKFVHPKSGEVVFGEQLLPGTELQETDVFPSDTGEWECCPIEGLTVSKESRTIWVRPDFSGDLKCLDGVTGCHDRSIERAPGECFGCGS